MAAVEGDLRKVYRTDGRVEIICEHGVGHTTYASAKEVAAKYKHSIKTWLIHGCDGCCEKYRECRK